MCKFNLTRDQEHGIFFASTFISIASIIVACIYGYSLIQCGITGQYYCPAGVILRDCSTGDKFEDWQCCGSPDTYCPCGYSAPTESCTRSQLILYSCIMIGMCIICCPSLCCVGLYMRRTQENSSPQEVKTEHKIIEVASPFDSTIWR